MLHTPAGAPKGFICVAAKEALVDSHGSWKAQLTGASCDYTYTRGVQKSLLIFHVPCLCPKELFPSQLGIQRFRAGLAVLRMLKVYF